MVKKIIYQLIRTKEKVFTVHMWLFPLSDCRIGRQSVIDDAHAHM